MNDHDLADGDFGETWRLDKNPIDIFYNTLVVSENLFNTHVHAQNTS
jgi:hypothetical protein